MYLVIRDSSYSLIDWISVIGQVLLGFGAVATFITVFMNVKYKNKELYIRRLREVYAPLYSFLCKQELARPILSESNERFKEEYDRISSPIYDFGNNNSSAFSEEDILGVLSDASKELMSPKLIQLYSELETACYLDEKLADNAINKKDLYEKIRIIQKELVNEIIFGYEECIKKINLDSKKDIKIEKI